MILEDLLPIEPRTREKSNFLDKGHQKKPPIHQEDASWLEMQILVRAEKDLTRQSLLERKSIKSRVERRFLPLRLLIWACTREENDGGELMLMVDEGVNNK